MIITLKTQIEAGIERCFLLSLSVDLHKASTADTKEEAIAGVTKGIMGSGDTVTWQARHFGIKFKMSTRISKYQQPYYFVSEMIEGPFKKIYHQHIFKSENGSTEMTDIFEFEAPANFFGRIAERLFLKKHMTDLLKKRNQLIKEVAEGTRWKEFL